MIEKEVRALLPVWTAAAVALVAGGRSGHPLSYFGLPLYFTAIAGLGAFSIGHEYAYGTLDSLLALPVPRWRQWVTKTGILLPMLLALAAIASYFVEVERGDRTFGMALFWLPALAALCLAPWLTMITGSPIAGAVFTLGIVGSSMAVGEWIGVYRFGFTTDVDDFRRACMGWMLGGLSAIGVVAGWRTFSHLQVSGGASRDLQLLVRRTASSSVTLRRRRPLVALLAKELRLQQLTFVVSAVYAAGSLAIAYSGRAIPSLFEVVAVLIAIYVITLPAVIGSLACAEERQFRTLESQLLLPVSVRRQWLVKTATAVVLTIALALLLPEAVSRLLPASAQPRGLITPQAATMVMGCLGISFYISSLARSGLTALVYSIAAIPSFGFFIVRIAPWLGEKAFRLVHHMRAPHTHRLLGATAAGPSVVGFVLQAAVVVVPMLVLPLTHYRYTERRPALVAIHAAIAAAGIIAYAVAIYVIAALRY